MRPFPNGRIIRDVAYWKAVLQLDPDDDEAERDARMDVERRAEESISRALERQRRALVPSNSPPTSVGDVMGRVEETAEPVADALRAAIIESADLGVAVAVEQFETIGFAFDWTLTNTVARDWASRHAAQLITRVNDTTRQQVRQSVSDWIDNGEPLSALVRELETTFGRNRASLIASTEVTRAYAEANRTAYRESGVVQRMEWRTANDERVCPICGPLQGKQTDLRNPDFDGIDNPPAHPRCRCWIVPVIDDA